MRVVTPYRPFAPESQAHEQLGAFDWIGAIEMLRVSVERSNHCETVAITDVDTALPGQVFQYETTERRLMLWILDVSLAYLKSDDFDRDTILLSPDLLVFGDLRPWMTEYFTVLMRSDYPSHPILNGVQFWPVRRKAAIRAFYQEALAIGCTLEERFLSWGGDTEPLRQLLAPLEAGLVMRDGKPLARLVESAEILHALTGSMVHRLGDPGGPPRPVRPVLDFRYTRKRYMRAYFEATIGRESAV